MIVSQAPLRISFFGGGTDYPEHFLANGGAVLGTAIDQSTLVAAAHFHSAFFDHTIRISYRRIEMVDHVDAIEHTPFREALRYFGFERDIELHCMADLPAKTGLGSSSTFVVALLQTLNALKGREVSGLQLAYEAIHFERSILREAVGCQDQTLAAVGGLNVLEFRAEDDIRAHHVPLDEDRMLALQNHLMLVYTGITRSAEDMAKLQLARMVENKAAYMRLRRHVDLGYLILTDGGPICRFGDLLHEAWCEKRALHPSVSNSAIDDLYERARASGALGGKLLGAGGGGFLLLFVPPERQPGLCQILSGFPVLRPRINAPGARLILAPSQRQAPVSRVPWSEV